MSDKARKPLTIAEIEGQQGSELPNREALSLVFGAVPLPAPLVAAASVSAAAQPAVQEAAESAAADAAAPPA